MCRPSQPHYVEDPSGCVTIKEAEDTVRLSPNGNYLSLLSQNRGILSLNRSAVTIYPLWTRTPFSKIRDQRAESSIACSQQQARDALRCLLPPWVFHTISGPRSAIPLSEGAVSLWRPHRLPTAPRAHTATEVWRILKAGVGANPAHARGSGTQGFMEMPELLLTSSEMCLLIERAIDISDAQSRPAPSRRGSPHRSRPDPADQRVAGYLMQVLDSARSQLSVALKGDPELEDVVCRAISDHHRAIAASIRWSIYGSLTDPDRYRYCFLTYIIASILCFRFGSVLVRVSSGVLLAAFLRTLEWYV